MIGTKTRTGRRLGEVAPNGATYFRADDGDIQEARQFLRDHGLEVKGAEGWVSTHGLRRGAIYFEHGGYVAAYWRAQ